MVGHSTETLLISDYRVSNNLGLDLIGHATETVIICGSI